MKNGWIGVDLDGTLARYDGWKGIYHIGEPIPAMVARVKHWLADGITVKIFTARVTPSNDREPDEVIRIIQDWCRLHIGQPLPVTNIKDFGMVELWDDRAVQVEPNTGSALIDRYNYLIEGIRECAGDGGCRAEKHLNV